MSESKFETRMRKGLRVQAEEEADKSPDEKKEKLEARLAAAEKRRQAAIHDKQHKAKLTSLQIIGMQAAQRKPPDKFCHTPDCWQQRPCSLHPVELPPLPQPRGGFAYSLNVYDELQEILPRMFLGNLFAAKRRDLMEKHSISHVLTVGTRIAPPEMGLLRKQLDVEDDSNVNLLLHMLEAFAFIDEGRGLSPLSTLPKQDQASLESSTPSSSASREDDSTISTPSESKSVNVNSEAVANVTRTPTGVLVHCAAGVSRSASVCIAYCMVRQKMRYEEAHAHVLKCRPVIRPNYGFTTQLKLLDELAGDVHQAATKWVSDCGDFDVSF